MDNVNNLGKRLSKKSKESETNKRRVSENFPQIERVADKLNPQQGFKHTFNTSDHPHNVRMNVYFNEPEKDCRPEPLDVFAIAVGQCPGFPFDFAVYPNGGYFNQVGGFVNNNQGVYPDNDLSSPGIYVPISGYYSIHFENGPAGVSTGLGTGVMAGISINGGVIIEQFYGAESEGLAFFSPWISVTTVVYLAAGDLVAGWMHPIGIAFWTPSDLCGFTGGHATTIELVGTV